MKTIVNGNERPFPPNKYVHWFMETYDSVAGDTDGELTSDDLLTEARDEAVGELNDLFEIQFDKVREEYHEFVAACPAYAEDMLNQGLDVGARFMEEGYDLLQALCQVLMMGEELTGLGHDTMVTSTILKCVARDQDFYRD